MTYFYWDASALGKRYAKESGTPLVNQLFDEVSANRMFALLLGAGEVHSILVRRRNGGLLSRARYEQAVAQFTAEVVSALDFTLEAVADSTVRNSFKFIPQYSLNATDAIVLRSALEIAEVLRAAGHELVLLASDSRLLGAAQGEGLKIFNPETGDFNSLRTLLSQTDTS